MTRNSSARKTHRHAASRRTEQRRRKAFPHTAVVAVLVVAVIAAGGWLGYQRFVTLPQKAGSRDFLSGVSLAAVPAPSQSAATPIIASYKDVSLRLPVETDDLTEVAFHQASYSYALDMATPLTIADTNATQKAHGTKRAVEQPHGEGAVLDGSILQLWRSGRKGKPDTALDVGAKPGTTLLSPVDGTVVLVKKYKLYKKWPDYEIHIQPTGHPNLDVVMIHVTDPSIVAGDKVVGGVTKVGSLRQLSDKMYLQLATYTAKKDGGNHTHIQVNNAKDPLYIKGESLKGAITVTD